MARTDTLEHFLQDLADGIREKTGETGKISPDSMDVIVKNIPSGGSEEKFTGHIDVEGLRELGWTDEDIQYFQENGINWNEENDDFYIVPTRDKGQTEPNTNLIKYIKKDSTRTNFTTFKSLIAVPYKEYATSTSCVNMFNGNYSLRCVPLFDTSRVTSMNTMFGDCYNLKKIPCYNTENVTSMAYTFQNCRKINEIPHFNTNKVTNIAYMFQGCYNLKKIPQFDTKNVENTSYLFSNCYNLEEIPYLDLGKNTQARNMFDYCQNLETIPELNFENVTVIDNLFRYCHKLKKVPNINCGKATNLTSMFQYCYILSDVGLIDCSSANNISNIFSSCIILENLAGLKNLGKGYTQKTTGYSSYTLTLNLNYLTHDSLMNVINNLYDLNLTYKVADGGTLYRQKLVLGNTNKNKLTADEIAIATNKGWDVS